MKNFHSKNFKRKFNIFIAEFPTRNFIHVIFYLYKKRFNRVSLFFYSTVYLARFSNCMQKFQQEKKVCINYWNLVNEQKQPLKKVFCKNEYSSKWLFWEYQAACMIKIFQKYLWRSSTLVKLQTYSLQLLRTRHFYRHILILLALITNKKRCEIYPVK